MKINKKIIKELSDYLNEFNLNEIEITEKDTKIKVSKNNISISNQPQVTSPSTSITNSVSSTSQNVKDDGDNYTGQIPNDATIKIFAVNYNILRIMSGMGGVAYTN